jgi:hypothetical protein
MGNKFQITRRYPGDNRSFIIAFAAAVGVPIMPHASTPDQGSLASGNFSGFLERAVVDISNDAKLLNAMLPNNGALPAEINTRVAVVLADEVEMESADYLVESGTGAITEASAIGTKLTPYQGKWRETQSGEVPYLRITGFPDVQEEDSNFRIRAEAIR